ncbi:hypothetical protein BV898_06196 [Hypsibius exemplaris]|uniref:Uncharacterized protein n=1 Tax=Hypsibius exemplaris TaxID=2072580 RepID=A0A1W0WXI9_HYPEX|nr:hypothetical protein BV898_06196 [Hypsibius exemplaris]
MCSATETDRKTGTSFEKPQAVFSLYSKNRKLFSHFFRFVRLTFSGTRVTTRSTPSHEEIPKPTESTLPSISKGKKFRSVFQRPPPLL